MKKWHKSESSPHMSVNCDCPWNCYQSVHISLRPEDVRRRICMIFNLGGVNLKFWRWIQKHHTVVRCSGFLKRTAFACIRGRHATSSNEADSCYKIFQRKINIFIKILKDQQIFYIAVMIVCRFYRIQVENPKLERTLGWRAVRGRIPRKLLRFSKAVANPVKNNISFAKQSHFAEIFSLNFKWKCLKTEGNCW